MGEILGMGLSHYPGFNARDDNMADIFRWTLEDPDIPNDAKDSANWPPAAVAELGSDGGAKSARLHREEVFSQISRLRERIDDFEPDFIVIWGDDQYENFREDIIPAFSVLAYDDVVAHPWVDRNSPNYWNEDQSKSFEYKTARRESIDLINAMLERSIDVAYAYEPHYHPDLPHAFMNALLFLDQDRKGFSHPIIPFPINCYGRRVISYEGKMSRFADASRPEDPISPTPARCMEVGAAVADSILDSNYRAVLLASSSWSHAFMVDRTWRLFPDTERDRELFAAMNDGDWETWRKTDLAQLEESGQQELLNWFTLAGAMERTGSRVEWSHMAETHIFNSSKVTALFEPTVK